MGTKSLENSPPRPPDHLIDRVSPNFGGVISEVDRISFDESGLQSAAELSIFVSSVGRSLDSFERVLDFGCGCGRVTRWLESHAEHWELHGCDIDKVAIEWCKGTLPFGSFQHSEPEPPLPYPGGYFDLIINHSVFTHIDERYQNLWLEELHRITKPGAIVILSVHGDRAFQIAENHMISGGEDPGPWRRILERDGILFIPDDTYLGGVFPDFYHTTFHAPWYVYANWNRWFDIRSYLPHADLGHQDVVVLERRPDDVPAPHAIRPPVGIQERRPLQKVKQLLVDMIGRHLLTPEDTIQRIPTVVHVVLAEHGERLRRLEERDS